MFEKRPPRIYNNVDLDDYELFVDIERCVHIEDILDYNRNTLSPSRLSRKDQSHLEDKGIFVLWFGIASTSSSSSHNVYGNVSFLIRFQTLLNQFHSSRKLYYLETVERTDSVLSRLLFTARDINQLKPAVELNLRHFGHPLLEDDGNYYHLKTIPGYKNGHNLEILIDMPKRRLRDAQWLFDECRKISVNHSEANSTNYKNGNYRLCKCYKYNNRQNECPHPFNEEQTYDYMKKECPRFLNTKKNKNTRDTVPSVNKGFEESKRPSLSHHNPALPQLRMSVPPSYQPVSVASATGYNSNIGSKSLVVKPVQATGITVERVSVPPSYQLVSVASATGYNSNIGSKSLVVKPVRATGITVERVSHLPSSKQKPCLPSNQRSSISYPANTSTYTQYSITGARPSSEQPVRFQASVVTDRRCNPCPKCREGEVSKQSCSIWFFLLRFLCCLEKRDRQCNNCGAKFKKSQLLRTSTRTRI